MDDFHFQNYPLLILYVSVVAMFFATWLMSVATRRKKWLSLTFFGAFVMVSSPVWVGAIIGGTLVLASWIMAVV